MRTGLLFRIVDTHKNEYGGRVGVVLDIGSFNLISGENRTGAIVDISEAILVIEANDLEVVEPDPPEQGWAEFDM